MRFFAPFLLITILTTGCGPDTSDKISEEASLAGRWELITARRDNVETGLLDQLYFDFQPDGIFLTNLLTNEEQTGTYLRDGGEIVTEGVAVPLTYTIEELDVNTLKLKTSYQGYYFDFIMERPGQSGEGMVN